MPPQTFTIFGILESEKDDPERVFAVDIAKTDTVFHLKKAMKAEKEALAEYDTDSIVLYLTEILVDDNFQENVKVAPQTRLTKPTRKLASIFPTGPQEEMVHIIVQPPKDDSRKRPRPPGSSDENSVVTKRRRILASSNVAPSSWAKPRVYNKLDSQKYAFNRPPSTDTIPLALLNAIFGRFVDNVQTYLPTARDNALVRELRQVMSTVYDTEAALCNEFKITIVKHYADIQFEPATIGTTSHQSDGHVRYKDFVYSVTEGKLLGNTVGDPEGQACGHFITSMKEFYKRKGDFPDLFPCIIIYFIGPFVCFSGTTVTDRVHLGTLTPAYSLHTNLHETEIAFQVTRAFGAFSLACDELKVYYEKLALRVSDGNRPEAKRVVFPYINHYMGGDEERVEFDYRERPRQPRHQVHTAIFEGCSSDKGVAPQLYSVENLPGGWMMVVMELLRDDAYILLTSSKVKTATLRDSLKAAIDILHQGGFVHGDIRDTNVMAKWDTGSRAANVKLLDFDWAGQEGTIRYPSNVNYEQIRRPADARDGMLIKKEHDLEMVGYILSGDN